MLSVQKRVAFQRRILRWFEQNRRDLPWRKVPYDTSLKQRDPYKILVSEVMLQQTQVGRVITKYKAWLKKFPTVTTLANASTKDVLTLWSGLGYNRRALNLQKVAVIISKEYKHIWPREKEALKKLPGIGEYTAGAILCFAFEQQIAVVDTNVRKVILLEILKGAEGVAKTKEVAAIAELLLPKGKAYEWNQALMDYAVLMLKKEKITIPKQSRFQGSNRFYRGKLLKLLLAEGPIALADIGRKLKDNFSQSENEWLLAMIHQMEKEGFIRTDGIKIRLCA